MFITLTKDISKATAITHNGIFHADEVFATVLIGKLFDEVTVCRTFKVPKEEISENVIVYDIGGGKFDHHMRNFTESRENKIKYSSFGLLWREFGITLLNKMGVPNAQYIANLFDEALVAGIDAVDNGQIEKTSVVSIMSVSGAISSFNPNWDENIDSDIAFLNAVQFAEVIFDNTLKRCIKKAKTTSGVEKAIANSDGVIMVLDEFMPWQEHLFASSNPKASGILYVIFPSKREGFNVNAVPTAPGAYSQKKPFPESWAGLNEQLAEVSGVETAIFCHKGRFIASAKTFEGAMRMAKIAVAD